MATRPIILDDERDTSAWEWLDEVRVRHAAEVEGMSDEEAVAHINRRGEAALRQLDEAAPANQVSGTC